MADRELSVRTDDGVWLSGEESGEADAPPIVLLHGLTATRRYVVMGSRLLERSGYRVIAYDARGHGHSSPAGGVGNGTTAERVGGPAGPTGGWPAARGEAAYGYERLARDLEELLNALDIPRAALAGASMGAHTALRFALSHPERVAALGLVTPAFDPGANDIATPEGDRDVLARALREGGVEGFVGAYDFSSVPPAWRETVERVVTQRLSLHAHPEAVADAMEAVGRSRPFEDFADLAAIAASTVVVASRDEVDPGHPLAVAERYAQAIPGAQLRVEDGGPPVRSPIAWQGGQLSKVLVELLNGVRYT